MGTGVIGVMAMKIIVVDIGEVNLVAEAYDGTEIVIYFHAKGSNHRL